MEYHLRVISTVDQSTESGGASPAVVNGKQEDFVVGIGGNILEPVRLVLCRAVVGVVELDSKSASACDIRVSQVLRGSLDNGWTYWAIPGR